MHEPVHDDSDSRHRRPWPRLLAAALAGALPVAAVLPAATPVAAAVRAQESDDSEDSGDDDAGDRDRMTISGSGFGHGVGMSQYGALGMARDGASVRKILRHYYTGTTVAPYRDDVDLRVGVVDRGSSVTFRTTPLASGGGAIHLVAGNGRLVRLPAGSTVVVTVDGGSFEVTATPAEGAARSFTTGGLTVRWSGARALAGPASVLTVSSRSANAGSTWRKTRSYRWGALHLTPVARTDSDGAVRTRIQGVAILNLHREYLRGIAEVPSSWPAAALQAQVIAARNYALAEYRAGRSSGCGGCHLWDDTRSQVYRGWSHESVAPRWLTAVAATQTSRTHGLTVLHRGTPITAYYSSSSGGRTRDSESAWDKALPYLRSVKDPWSVDPDVNPGYARWQREVSRSKVAAAFGLPDVESVEVTERDRGGAAVSVTATSSDGDRASLSGGAVRTRLGLPAPWYRSFD